MNIEHWALKMSAQNEPKPEPYGFVESRESRTEQNWKKGRYKNVLKTTNMPNTRRSKFWINWRKKFISVFSAAFKFDQMWISICFFALFVAVIHSIINSPFACTLYIHFNMSSSSFRFPPIKFIWKTSQRRLVNEIAVMPRFLRTNSIRANMAFGNTEFQHLIYRNYYYYYWYIYLLLQLQFVCEFRGSVHGWLDVMDKRTFHRGVIKVVKQSNKNSTCNRI